MLASLSFVISLIDWQSFFSNRLNETPVSNENFYPHTNKLINVMGTRKDNSPVINCDSYREQSRGLIIRRGGVPPMQLQFNKNQDTNLFPVRIGL